MKIYIRILAFILSFILCCAVPPALAAFAVSDEFDEVQDTWADKYTAEFPVDEITLPQSPVIGRQDLQYKYAAATQADIFNALLATNAQTGNKAAQSALVAAGMKREPSAEPLVAIYSKLSGKILQVYIVFRNALPENPAKFAADCGNPIRYMDFDDSVHSYFSSTVEPAMRDKKLYALCQTARSDANVRLVFCGTQFGGGFALIGAAIASRDFAIPAAQLQVIQFSAPSVTGKGFVNAFKDKFPVINLVRPNDPSALLLNSLDFFPFGDVTTVPCNYSNLLDFSSLYKIAAEAACANYITDIWNNSHPENKYTAEWFPAPQPAPAIKADTGNINTQQYLFLGSLTAAAAFSVYDSGLGFTAGHLRKHAFALNRYSGPGLRLSPASPYDTASFNAVYSTRKDTDGKHYYIIGIAADVQLFLNRCDKNFIVESPQFGHMLKPIADDLNLLTADKDFSDFINAATTDKSSRILVSGYGTGGSYAAYLAAWLAANPATAPEQVRLCTLGDFAAVSTKMQTILTEKVRAFRVDTIKDGVPPLGELLNNNYNSAAALFMPQGGERCGITEGFVTDYKPAGHNIRTYVGLSLRYTPDYIRRWNDEAFLRNNTPAGDQTAPEPEKQKEPVTNERMICVTSPCSPW